MDGADYRGGHWCLQRAEHVSRRDLRGCAPIKLRGATTVPRVVRRTPRLTGQQCSMTNGSTSSRTHRPRGHRTYALSPQLLFCSCPTTLCRPPADRGTTSETTNSGTTDGGTVDSGVTNDGMTANGSDSGKITNFISRVPLIRPSLPRLR